MIISLVWRLGSRSGQTPQQCFARRRAPRQSRPGGRLALGSEVRRRALEALEALEALCHLQTVWRRTQPGGGSGEGAEQVREGGGGMSLYLYSVITMMNISGLYTLSHIRPVRSRACTCSSHSDSIPPPCCRNSTSSLQMFIVNVKQDLKAILGPKTRRQHQKITVGWDSISRNHWLSLSHFISLFVHIFYLILELETNIREVSLHDCETSRRFVSSSHFNSPYPPPWPWPLQ